MNSLEILENQISAQIEGRDTYQICFSDCDYIDRISLYAQDGKFWIEVWKCKRISKEMYEELDNVMSAEGNVGKYDEFYNKYYNYLPAIED